MADQVSVFCRDEPPPSLSEILDFLSEEGFDVSLDNEEEVDEGEVNAEDPSWAEGYLIYSNENEPMQLECLVDGESDEFVELRDELIEALDDAEGSGKNRALRHLRASAFAIRMTLVDGGSEEAKSMQNALINYLASHHEGIAYLEGEGYYLGDELVLDLS